MFISPKRFILIYSYFVYLHFVCLPSGLYKFQEGLDHVCLVDHRFASFSTRLSVLGLHQFDTLAVVILFYSLCYEFVYYYVFFLLLNFYLCFFMIPGFLDGISSLLVRYVCAFFSLPLSPLVHSPMGILTLLNFQSFPINCLTFSFTLKNSHVGEGNGNPLLFLPGKIHGQRSLAG